MPAARSRRWRPELGWIGPTVRKYVAPAEAAGLSPGGPSSRAEWSELVAGWFPELVDAKAWSLTWPSIDVHRERIGDMLKTNTVTTVHQRLRDEHHLTVSITSFRRYLEESLEIARKLKAHAEATGRTAAQLALAWLWANRIISSVIAGPRTLAQWKDYVAAVGTPWTDDDEALVDSLVRPGPSVDARLYRSALSVLRAAARTHRSALQSSDPQRIPT